MGNKYPLRAGGTDRGLQAWPVHMVRHHKTTVHTAPAPRAAQLHPATGERIGVVTKTFHPGRSLRRRWRQHDAAAQLRNIGQTGDRLGYRQLDTGLPVDPRQRLHRTVQQDRADLRVQPGQQTLRLAERITEQHAGALVGRVVLPPAVDVGKNLLLRLPLVDRQGKGGLGHKCVAWHRLERRTGAVSLHFVVARHHPDFAARLQPYLGRAQHMPGRMQAELHAVVHHRLAVGQGVERDICPQAVPQYARTRGRRQIVGTAGSRMVAVTVGNHRPLHRSPGVDIEIARRAIQAFGAGDHKVHENFCRCGGRRIFPAFY